MSAEPAPRTEATPAESMGLPERLRTLAEITEAGCKSAIAQMPAEEMLSTMKMVEDFRAAADSIESFDALIAVCLGKAGPLLEYAQELSAAREKTDLPPSGPSLDWIREAGS